MPLLKISDFDPNYRETFEGDDIKGLGVYTEGDEKIGTVNDVLVDDNGQFRYLVVDLGFWIFGKKVLLPIGRSRIDYNADRVYAVGMTRQQAENLPEFSENMAIDHDYEERVRGVYRPAGSNYSTTNVESSMPVEAALPIDTAYTAATPNYSADITAPVAADMTVPATADRSTYDYNRDRDLYGMNERDHQTLRLYEERLIANKNRFKAGEVAVGKRVETETARVSVPIDKERVVIERTNITDAGTAVTPGEVDFQEGEVARIEVYEETPDIRKEAFVREEVRVRKEVEHNTVDAEETLRRERLDVNTQGNPVVDRTPDDRI